MNYDRSIETEGAIPAMHDRMVDSELSDFGTDDDARAPNKRRIVIAIIVLAVIAAIVGFFIWRSSAAPEQSEVLVPIVSVVMPGNTTVAGEITATGTLGARRPMPSRAPGAPMPTPGPEASAASPPVVARKDGDAAPGFSF